MLKYLLQDFRWALGYLPFGLLAAGIFFIVALLGNAGRMKQGKETQSVMASVCFWSSLLIIFCLTLLSRENGSTSKIDLEIGSTLRINARNNAYVVENVLLFMPFGFCLAWRYGWKKKWIRNILLGLATTVAVECTQLLTGRGVFQIDDIITNAIGCVLGQVLFVCLRKTMECVFTQDK